MAFKVETVSDEDFPELIAAQWKAFENPFQGLLRMFFPVYNNDYEASLRISTEGQLADYHKEQPAVTWIKIMDTEANNKIVGAAKWYFFQENPHTHHGEKEPFSADWYPEGTTREFVTRAIVQFEGPRERMAQRPHAFLHIAFTLPEYRGRGIGHMFMNWGLEKADALGLESWLDASDYGQPLYEKHGFQKILHHNLSPQRPENLSEKEEAEWARCERELLPVSVTVMWRPPLGKAVAGQPRPWEV